ncbi:MAG: hypothetical protein QME40_02690 [bacterium]|nr:hypothetical protein [bacterium]
MGYKIGSFLGKFAFILTILITLERMWLLLEIIPLPLLIFKVLIRGVISFLLFFTIGWVVGFILELKIPQVSEFLKSKAKEKEEKKEKPGEESHKEERPEEEVLRQKPEEVAKAVRTLLQE